MIKRRPHDDKAIVDGERRRVYVVRAEQALGRKLPRRACVHHHTEEQLVVCENQAYHLLLHARTRVVRAGGNPDTQKVCGMCGELKSLTDFSPWVNGTLCAACKPCRSRYEKQRRLRQQEEKACHF